MINRPEPTKALRKYGTLHLTNPDSSYCRSDYGRHALRLLTNLDQSRQKERRTPQNGRRRSNQLAERESKTAWETRQTGGSGYADKASPRDGGYDREGFGQRAREEPG